MSKSGRTGRTRTTVRIEKRIDGQRSGTALAFSAVAPWERPGLAAHLVLSHPQRLALWSVPTIVTSCRHCGLQAMANRVRFAVNISIRANGALSEPINLGPATLFSVHALTVGGSHSCLPHGRRHFSRSALAVGPLPFRPEG